MGLSSFLKKIAPIAIGGLVAGPLLGGLGSAFGGATGGGIGSLIGGFQSSGIGKAFGIGTQAFSLFSSFKSNQLQVEQAQLSNAIQAQNTLETIKLFDLKEKAFDKEEESIKSGAELQAEQLSESRDRIQRSLGFELGTVGRKALELEERFRTLNVQEQKLLGASAASAAARGVRVSSSQVALQQEEISRETQFARNQVQLARDEIEQQSLEIQQQATDALFDADMQARLNLRSQGIQEDRLSFEREANKIKEQTARHLAALQGISIPNDTGSPSIETPEEKQNRLEERLRRENILKNEIDSSQFQVPKGEPARDIRPGDPLFGLVSGIDTAFDKALDRTGKNALGSSLIFEGAGNVDVPSQEADFEFDFGPDDFSDVPDFTFS
jgi:hypothetical protein